MSRDLLDYFSTRPQDIPSTSTQTASSTSEVQESEEQQYKQARVPEAEPPRKQARVLALVDICDFSLRRDVSEADKYQFIHTNPSFDQNYTFPKGAKHRSFQYTWLQKYPWLKYSEKKNGGYCLPCVMFAKNTSSRADPGILVKSPMTDFKHAIETFNKHSDKKYHRDAIIVMDNFVKSMSGQTQSISVQISDATRKLVERNRQKLRSIVETIIFCGRQNIALRGSFESYSDVEERTSKNHGNFWALIKFRISAGDTILQDHFATTSRNATYTSPTIQNDIINIVGDHIRQILISKVRTAQFFSLIADEVTDCSNKEQLAIVLRHVDPDNNQIREDLVDFVECDTGITGKALADKMLEFLKKQCLDLSKLCGQTYDGAASMSGKIKGAAAIITSKYPLALYTHCASHRLNLAVAHSFSETCVQNMISIVNRVSTFFWAHPKRQKKLDEAIDSIQPTSSVSKLKDLCRTRWIERIDALDRLSSLSLVHVHRDIDIDIDQVIDEFARRHPRRLQLESIINS